MSVTWTTPSPHTAKAVCSTGSQYPATPPTGTDGLNLDGSAAPAFGGVGSYDVNIESHDGVTTLTGGTLRCYTKNSQTGNWYRNPGGDLTTSDGVLGQSVQTVAASSAGSVAYVPDGLVAAVDIYLVGDFKRP